MFTQFENPLSYTVFPIVGQNLLNSNSLEINSGVTILGAVCLQASDWLLCHSAYYAVVFLVPRSGREVGQPSGLVVGRRMIRVLES
jgi:hypothetical protein